MRSIFGCLKILWLLGVTLWGNGALGGSCPSFAAAGSVMVSWVEAYPDASHFGVGWDDQSPWEVRPAMRLAQGEEVEIVRCLPPGRMVVVARGTVTSMSGSMWEADVRSAPVLSPAMSESSARLLLEAQREAQIANLYPRPMAGDAVIPVSRQVVPHFRISPKLQLSFSDLFVVSGGDMTLSDLSEEGKRHLMRAVEIFRGRSGRLAVEGRIHRLGNRDRLRELSQERAMVVAEFLQNALGVPEGAVVAIGLGSEEMAAGVRAYPMWPLQDQKDSITLRLIP